MPTQTANTQEASVTAPPASIGEIFSKRAASMNRLLSRREKDGAPHKRAKSRDKSADKKVMCWEHSQFSAPRSYRSRNLFILNLLPLFALRFRNRTAKARRSFSSHNLLFMQQLLILDLVSCYRLDRSLVKVFLDSSRMMPRRKRTRTRSRTRYTSLTTLSARARLRTSSRSTQSNNDSTTTVIPALMMSK